GVLRHHVEAARHWSRPFPSHSIVALNTRLVVTACTGEAASGNSHSSTASRMRSLVRRSRPGTLYSSELRTPEHRAAENLRRSKLDRSANGLAALAGASSTPSILPRLRQSISQPGFP